MNNIYSEWLSPALALLTQFTGGRGGVDNIIVPYGIAAFFYTVLLVTAQISYKKNKPPREYYLRLGFMAGLLRESFMLCMAFFYYEGIASNNFLQAFFPPLEHVIRDIALITIASGYLRFCLNNTAFPRYYLYIGVVFCLLVYFSTFLWWANYITENPSGSFGQVWCEWLFRLNASFWIGLAVIMILIRATLRSRKLIALALSLFFLYELLKIPDIALHESYEYIFTPFRRSFYLIGIMLLGYVYFIELINRKDQMEIELQEQKHLLDKVVENIPSMVFLQRVSDQQPVLFNLAGEKITGFTREQLFNNSANADFLAEYSKLFTLDDPHVFYQTGYVNIPELTISKNDSSKIILHMQKVLIRDESERPLYLLGIAQNITESKRNEQQIAHLAYHDQLTGLPNRTLFLDRLDQAQSAAWRHLRFGAVLFVDLDQFKQINDVYGHAIGDKVLKNAAQHLKYYLRQDDTVARFGGDEFVILLTELSSDQDTAATLALSVAEKVRLALEQPVLIDGQNYRTTTSIGVSLYPKQGKKVDDIIREADIAMYRAKESGRNASVFFEPDMQAHIAERYALEQDLQNALKQGRLELFLQSQVNKLGELVGAEALLRWRHPSRGLIMPATFIPLAEETGLIVQIGEWVLRETCRIISRLSQMGLSLHLVVNVSPRQFYQEDFVNRIQAILEETGADPLYLTLEVTESLLIERTNEVVSRMQALSELGIRFSIDDFGTGYSSLSYLRRLPLNELKIDKSFIQDIPHDINSVALVKTILSMAHHLGFRVVAEGVETQAQHEFIATLDCEHFQGYLFHRPQHFREWLTYLEG